MVGRQDGIALWESQNEGELTTAELYILCPQPPTHQYLRYVACFLVCVHVHMYSNMCKSFKIENIPKIRYATFILTILSIK